MSVISTPDLLKPGGLWKIQFYTSRCLPEYNPDHYNYCAASAPAILSQLRTFNPIYCYGPPPFWCVRRKVARRLWATRGKDDNELAYLVKVTHARSPPFNCPHTTETSEPYVRWHATIYNCDGVQCSLKHIDAHCFPPAKLTGCCFE